jgi:two-component system chemotaxis response regulator CheY
MSEITFWSFTSTVKEGAMGLGRILVVDDEAHIRTTVRMALTKAGYDVVEAEDGAKGIQSIKSGDNPLLVDMILCDMQMPNIDGIGAISFFLQQFPSVPVVVMTGHPDINTATKLMKQGVKDYLVKPIEKEKLLAVVEDAVKQRQIPRIVLPHLTKAEGMARCALRRNCLRSTALLTTSAAPRDEQSIFVLTTAIEN